MDEYKPQATEFDSWNPGLVSTIPDALMPFVTLYRSENSAINYQQAKELSGFSGLETKELVFFLPERLIVHELLVRVSADLSVPDGPNYEDLGINLRATVDNIYRKYVFSNLAEIDRLHKNLSADTESWMTRELETLFEISRPAPARAAKGSILSRIFGQKTNADDQTPKGSGDIPAELIGVWTKRLNESNDPFETACLTAIIHVIRAIVRKRGRLIGDRDLIGALAMPMVCNTYGSEQIGKAIAPFFEQAVEEENYVLVPAQAKPVIMNVKGASAAGKSTIRPDQMRLAGKLNIPWEHFAIISPDYWRKYLLDYNSLGENAKYAAMLTGQELEIVDQKLDRYMAEKAAKQKMSHLLIDRFRFDSFFLEKDGAVDSTLLTRFGDLVFMFFMITAPEETVERAWQRGLKTGRYKAVDDLLFHNVEAYTGMPELFFSWALSKTKRIHYEFLDNNVAQGERPRTVAFGWNGNMTILDVKCMLEIDRYRKVNVKANQISEIYGNAEMAPQKNAEFLKRCRKFIPTIQFADYQTGYVYGKLVAGDWIWRDEDYLDKSLDNEDWQEGLRAIGWFEAKQCEETDFKHPDLGEEKAYTLGAWAPELAK